jgi:Xaa-Pro dipeptidase
MRQLEGLPFSLHEYSDRLARVRSRMEEKGLDALLVTIPNNLYYLTGYDTQGLWYFTGLIIPPTGEPCMVTRFAEDTVVEADTWLEQSRPFRDYEEPMEVLRTTLDEFSLLKARLGYEGDSHYFRCAERDGLVAACPDVELVDVAGLIEAERVTKSPQELEYMRRAARATNAGMAAGIEAIHQGGTDNEVAAAIYEGLILNGSHYCPLSPFVAAGPHSFVSHATWRDRHLTEGDCLFLEVGGNVLRYQTAMMRTAVIGGLSSRLKRAQELVNEAFDAAVAAIKPGVVTADVDEAARKIISANDLGAIQYARVGYSIGIACPPGWGEGHVIDLNEGNTNVLEENMTFHLIPGLQIPGEAAVGMSETVRVTGDGCERLTELDRRIFEC